MNVTWATFVGRINEGTVCSLITNLDIATQRKTETVHLLFQSSGGDVAEGVTLYNYFRNMSIGLVLYNTGSVSSIATLAYMGAKKRVCSKYGTFMLHRVGNSPDPRILNMDTLPTVQKLLEMDDARVRSIIETHVKLPVWDNLGHNQLWFTAEDAHKNGFVDEVGEFVPPRGAEIYAF